MKYQYTIHDLVIKRWRDGGCSINQVVCLYEKAKLYDLEQLKFIAAIHGLDVEDKKGKTTKSAKSNNPLFMAPEDYEHLSKEKRQELTDKMKRIYKPLTERLNRNSGVIKR